MRRTRDCLPTSYPRTRVPAHPRTRAHPVVYHAQPAGHCTALCY